ncbi:MAG: CASTOR/POLLUX-related putative ion channel [Anaerovoracaceae bacterium]
MSERLKYKFDNIMAKGTISLILLLLLVTVIVVALVGFFSFAVNAKVAGSLGNSFWQNLMCALDAGSLAGVTIDSGPAFVLLMTFTTVIGIFVTSILIGLISAGLEDKFDSLKKGKSKVVEKNHTVIIGYDENIFTMLPELIEANDNGKKPRVVIMADLDKEEMDTEIRSRIGDFRNTKVITRTGDTSDIETLRKCSLEEAKSIIINEAEDTKKIKSILAISEILKSVPEKPVHITTVINDEKNLEIAKIAGGGRTEALYFRDAISRIVAHTSRQPGLSAVYTELFDFDGDELYIEKFSELVGKKFKDSINLFPKSSVFGIVSEGKAKINPAMNHKISEEDEIIILAEDDGVSFPNADVKVEKESIVTIKETESHNKESMLILGYNDLLIGTLAELDLYVDVGSKATVVTDNKEAIQEINKISQSMNNFSIETKEKDIQNRETLESLLNNDYKHIILLSDDTLEVDEADGKTLLVLLYLKDISEKKNVDYSVTSEIKDVKNRELAQMTNVADFVVSSNLTSLMTTQISEKRLLASIFDDLLRDEGSELYMKPASEYVLLETQVNFATVVESAAQKSELAVGYKKASQVITNPEKSEQIIFTEEDAIIVLAEEG